MSIRFRLITAFVLIGIVPTLIVGTWGLRTLNQASTLAIEQSKATVAELGEEAILETALATARQIDLYLEIHPEMGLHDAVQLQNDTALAEIAVQPVGQTGYTAVHDVTGVNHFHSNPKIVGMDLHDLSATLPEFWAILEASLLGQEVSGYYAWEDADGTIRDKYMTCVPVGTTGLVVAATT